MSTIQSSCAYCGVGCGVSVSSTQADWENADVSTLTLTGDSQHPANHGHLCAKGERLLDSLSQPNVLRYPVLRSGIPIAWDEASSLIADKFAQTIAKYGPNSVALYLSGQLLTEDYYVANKFVKGYLKTANVDTNSRLCMSSAVSAMQRTFGEDVVPGCYDDIEHAEVIILIGANTAWTHPVLFQRILAAKKANQTTLVVIDPVATATAKQADIHLAVAPGADLALFHGLLGYLADNKQLDHEYIATNTQGFEEVVGDAQLLSADVAKLAKQVGVTEAELTQFYQLFTQNRNVLTASCQGINQSVIGTDTTNAIINCHLALGHVGRAGSGFFSLTGQPNAMGGREVGGLATQLACHMGFSAPERELLADFWQVDHVADKKGLAAVDMFDAVAQGTIKAIWIMGTNPVVSLPNSNKIAQALADCPFVVVSEISPDSDTAKLADVLLPAQGWSEKCGTVTNSERTITRQRGFIAAKGQSKPDWWAISQVAQKMGFNGFEFTNSASVFREFAGLSAKVKQVFPSKIFDLSGLTNLSDSEYNDLLPTQWPIASADQIGQQGVRVFTHGVFATPTGKAQFVTPADTNMSNSTTSTGTVILNSGRSRDQWHTMTRTGHIASLRASIPEPIIQLHPETLAQYSVKEGELVTLESDVQHNTSQFALARVVIDQDIPKSMALMSMHWSEQFSLGKGVNQYLDNRVDPVSLQPGFKSQAVVIKPVELALQGIVFGSHDPSAQGMCWQVAQTLTTGVCHHIGFSRAEDGFAYQSTPHSLLWSANVNGQRVHVQCNMEKDIVCAIKVLSTTRVHLALEPMNAFIGKPIDKTFIKKLHQQINAGNSPLICACTGVTEAQIANQINAEFDQQVFHHGKQHLQFDKALDATQSSLGCGRQCGSCQSEVKQCAQAHWQQALTYVDLEYSTEEDVA
ncbi:molybdopterin-dependent oxidoreductase [Shewanella inventionis]|uniref:Nitrite reductase n=1 Tax=Shewanella inventionis TaxID=1738770 RepID=A0ABQ1JEN6_9GAMM|nr:molybdopterin-dependent oxidoreductase [Shewanella inventionis]MCL1158203.1 molybdopterin-dependent oxidoreductase [Shewanella inventionis]UAL42230.1 molybdopterin-dependent oxidoreductase [Shewanella inventionis]GGB64919.1 nitrite reductase [Shewanella inventionis]